MQAHFSRGNSNLFYFIICPLCGEKHTSETGVGKTKLRDCVRQHIKQRKYQKLNVEEHFRTCGTFKIFPLLQMRSSEKGKRFHEKIQNKIK